VSGRSMEKEEQMCGRSSVARKPGFGLWQRSRGHRGVSEDFFGMDVGKLGPRAQVAVALVVLVPVMLSGLLLIAFVPGLWWVFTTYGWVAFPASGLLARGLSGLSDVSPEQIAAEDKERELLIALREHGELTPVRAATETSLSVEEADRMLEELAAGGHLEVRARRGGLFYALWTPPSTTG
jgi:hypothetical protein